MSNPTMESIIHEPRDLKRMREELDAAITSLEDSIKAVMGDEELITAGVYKVSWKTFTSSRVDTTALQKERPDIAAKYDAKTTFPMAPPPLRQHRASYTTIWAAME